MKNSFSLNLEIGTSRPNHWQRYFKGMLSLLIVIALAIAGYFFLPQINALIVTNPTVATTASSTNTASSPKVEVSSEKTVKIIPLPDLEAIRTAQYHAISEQEVQHLLNLKQIDLLTQYVEKHYHDEAKTLYVEKIKAERDKQCRDIEAHYQSVKKDYATFLKMKKQYGYSCPQAVANFLESYRASNKKH